MADILCIMVDMLSIIAAWRSMMVEIVSVHGCIHGKGMHGMAWLIKSAHGWRLLALRMLVPE
jgi:hypothetical protein